MLLGVRKVLLVVRKMLLVARNVVLGVRTGVTRCKEGGAIRLRASVTLL